VAVLGVVSYARGQEQLSGRAVHPADHAVDVATNTGVLVEFDPGAAVNSTPAAILLRSDGGTIVGLPDTARRPVYFDEQGRRTSSGSGAGFELQTRPLALQANTHYLIQSGAVGCRDNSALSCPSENYTTIAEFDTGSGPDVVAPVIRSSGAPVNEGGCRWRIAFDTEDDHTPAEAIRYLPASPMSIEQGVGPEVTLRLLRSNDVRTLIEVVSPIDQSGNEGEPFALELDACETDTGADLGCDTPGCPDDDGCMVQAPGAGRGGWLGVLSLVLGAAMRLSSRRQRSGEP